MEFLQAAVIIRNKNTFEVEPTTEQVIIDEYGRYLHLLADESKSFIYSLTF
jgi:hypothetical protein